jgi:hypothetical protein
MNLDMMDMCTCLRAADRLLPSRLGWWTGRLHLRAAAAEGVAQPEQGDAALKRPALDTTEHSQAAQPAETAPSAPPARSPDAAAPAIVQTSAAAPGILTDATFALLEVCKGITRAIEAMGHQYLTHVQHAAILPLLQGKDLLGAARTGTLRLHSQLHAVWQWLACCTRDACSSDGALSRSHALGIRT